MPDFQPIEDYVLSREGKVLENVAGDAGGLTWWGISQEKNPDWAGWALVNAHIKGTLNFIEAGAACNADENLINLTHQFYYDAWIKGDFEAIDYQEMALQLFHKNWNMGGIALKVFQVLLGLPADGVIGPLTANTFNALNLVDQSRMVDKFLSWASAHYTDIVARHPEDVKFYKGWEGNCVRTDS